jgi:mRNA-degrading endonuclease toxin of MazEF toxin-antitoxin module
VNLNDVSTIRATDLGRQIGRLLPEQEAALTDAIHAIHAAFDLD